MRLWTWRVCPICSVFPSISVYRNASPASGDMGIWGTWDAGKPVTIAAATSAYMQQRICNASDSVLVPVQGFSMSN